MSKLKVIEQLFTDDTRSLTPLRRVRRSLDAESAKALVHAFVTSRVDYCNTVFACAPKSVTDRLQRVLNSATRNVSDTKKFD